MKLHAQVRITLSTPPYEVGERYDVLEDIAATLLKAGRAELVKVPDQTIDGAAVGDGELAACAGRLAALAPRAVEAPAVALADLPIPSQE